MITAEPNYVGLSDELSQLDEQINALQGAKKDIYTKVRENYGKKTADALKLAVKMHSLPEQKRQDRDAVEEDAFRILAIIQAPRVARGARTHGNVEEFSSYAQAKLVENVAAGMQTESGRKALVTAVDIMIERDEHIDPETGEITNPVAKASEDNGTHGTHDGQGVTGDASRPSVGGGAHAADTSEGASANVSEGVTAGETAPNSETTLDPRPLTDADGHPRIPSSSPGCAKTNGLQSIGGQGRESENCIMGNQKEQAVDQFTPPAFLKAASEGPKLNPQCQKAAKGEKCTFSHSMASCWRCTDSAMKEKSAASKRVSA